MTSRYAVAHSREAPRGSAAMTVADTAGIILALFTHCQCIRESILMTLPARMRAHEVSVRVREATPRVLLLLLLLPSAPPAAALLVGAPGVPMGAVAPLPISSVIPHLPPLPPACKLRALSLPSSSSAALPTSLSHSVSRCTAKFRVSLRRGAARAGWASSKLRGVLMHLKGVGSLGGGSFSPLPVLPLLLLVLVLPPPLLLLLLLPPHAYRPAARQASPLASTAA